MFRFIKNGNIKIKEIVFVGLGNFLNVVSVIYVIFLK